MGFLFSYALSSSLILGALCLIYKWVLAGENYHKLNRSLLLLIYVVSLAALPVMDTISDAIASPGAQSIEIEFDQFPVAVIADGIEPEHTNWAVYAVWIYLGGAVVVGCMTLWSLFTLASIIGRSEVRILHGRKVVISDSVKYAPFSLGRLVVMSSKDFEESADVILLHEESHIKLMHWFDLLLAQAFCIFQWFNPAAWLMRRELRTVHEYQADARVISRGTDILDYQMLLIKKAVGARFPSLANSLNHSNLKKRITMMYNQKKKRSSLLRPLTLAPALCAALAVTQLPAVASILSDASRVSDLFRSETDGKVDKFSADMQIALPEDEQAPSATTVLTDSYQGSPEEGNVNESSALDKPESEILEKSEEERPHTTAEQIAEFPGGPAPMMEHLKRTLKYPKDGCPDGRVIIRFTVSKEGKVKDPLVVRGLTPEADEAALQAVRTLPDFIPAMDAGKPVATYFTLPVSFKATKDESSDANHGSSTSTSTSTSSSDGKTVSATVSNQGGSYSASASGPYEIYVDGVKKNWTTEELNRNLNPHSISDMKIDQRDGMTKIYVNTKK